MLTFKQLREQYIELLTEDRIDFLKQQYKDGISTEHDPNAKAKTSDKIVDHFANKADPTSGKLHTNWLLNQYRRGAIRQGDAAGLKSTLGDFEKVKSKLEKNDINAYKTVGELRDAIATQKPRVEAEAKSKKATTEKRGAEMEKLYDKDGVVGFKVPNKEVSVKNYGPAGKLCQSRWCTAAAGRNNMWDSYNGGKYTMHFPNGNVLQLHHQSGQLKDLSNKEISDGDSRYAPYANHIHDFIKQTADKEGESHSRIGSRFHSYSPEEVDGAIQNYKDSDKGRYAANMLAPIIEKGNLSSEHIKKLHEFDKPNTYFNGHTLSGGLIRNPNISTEELEKAHAKFKAEDKNAIEPTEFFSNPKLKGDLLNKVFAHQYGADGRRYSRELLAMHNPNLQDSHISHIIANSPNEHQELLRNHGITLTKEHQNALLNSGGGESIHRLLSQRNDVHPDAVDHIIKKASEGENANPYASTTDQLIKNPNVQLTKDHIDKVLNSGKFNKLHMGALFDSHHTAVDDETRNKIVDKLASTDIPGHVIDDVLDSKKFTTDHLEKFASSSPDIIAKHPKATSEQLHKVIASHGDKYDVQENILGNHKAVKPEHLKAISDKMTGSETGNWDHLFRHKNVTPDVLHHVYDNTKNTAIKGAVLHHPAVQLSHFTKATNEGDLKLHGAISSSPAAPPSALHKMADSPFQYVKMNVVKHKNTGQETMKKLAGSEDTTVADAASKKVKA